MTIGIISIVHFVIKVPKLVQMIDYRVHVPILNPRWSPKIQDGRNEIQFFYISTSNGGDFPSIIEIALLFITSFIMILQDYMYKKQGLQNPCGFVPYTYLYYHKTFGLCLWMGVCVPNRLENHLHKLDILWHTVSLGLWQ